MKKIIFFILLFIANYTYSQVKVSADGGIIPTGIYPSVDGNDVRGAVHEVQSIIDRNNIPANFRRLGMLAYVVDSLRYYQLKTGLTNNDWYEFKTRSGDTTLVELPLYVDTANGVRTLKILHDDGLISGGIVTKGVGDWDLDVTNAVYYIGHKAYSSSSSIVAIDTADATYDRIDRIAVDTTGSVIVITGTPSATPIAPQINPSSQIALTTITVKASSTLAPIITKIIYDEGTEWDTATSGTITASFGNEDNPYHDTKDIFVQTYENGGALEFTDSEPDTVVSNMVLKYFIYLNSEFTNSFQVQFFYDSDPVSNSLSFNSGFGLNPNNVNVYQNISIPLTSFNFSSNYFNKVKITMAGEDVSGAAGYYLDYIQLQKGLSQTGSGSCPLCIVDIHVSEDSTQQIGIRQNGDTAFVINWTGSGGSGGGITLYNGNGSLTSDRLVHLDGKKLFISNIDDPEQNAFLYIDPIPGDENSYLASVDGNGYAALSLESNVTSGYNFDLAISDGINESTISGNANNNEIEYRSGVHRFRSNLDSTKVVIQDAPIMSTTPTYIAAFDGDTLKKAINSGGGINSIVAGDNIDVDNTDPSNPVVSAVLNGITTASNGLTKVGNDVQLGGTQTDNILISRGTSPYYFQISNNNSSYFALTVVNTGGTSIYSYGFPGSETAVIEGQAQNSNIGIRGSSRSGFGIEALTNTDDTSKIYYALNVKRSTGGSPNRLKYQYGTGIKFTLENNATPYNIYSQSNSIISRWSNPFDSVKTSEILLTGVNNNIYDTVLRAKGDGNIVFDKYGSGAFTGTPTYNLSVDASGNIIETSLGGGSTPSFDDVTAVGNTSSVDITVNGVNMGAGHGSVISNTAVGGQSLNSNTTATSNTGIGYYSSRKLTTGSNNTSVGAYSLQMSTTPDGNTAIGEQALQLNTTGANNTALGFRASLSQTTLNNTTALGANSAPTQDNQVVLGDENITQVLTYGNILSKIAEKSTDPTTTDIPDGFTAVYKNTTSGNVYLWVNNGGTMLKIELQ